MSARRTGGWEIVIRHSPAARPQSMARHEHGWRTNLVAALARRKSVTRLLRYRSLHTKIQRRLSRPSLVDRTERSQSHEPGHARELRSGPDVPARAFYLKWPCRLLGPHGAQRQNDRHFMGARKRP